jgi:hypothetical protein
MIPLSPNTPYAFYKVLSTSDLFNFAMCQVGPTWNGARREYLDHLLAT